MNERWISLEPNVKQQVERTARKPNGVIMLYPGQSLHGIAWYFDGINPVHLTDANVKKLFLETKKKSWNQPGLNEEWRGKGLMQKASNTWISGGWEEFSFETLVLFSLLSFMYGGIHASSWNAHFPSKVEQLMWRGAVCSVSVGGFVISGTLLVLGILGHITKSPREDLKSWITKGVQWGWGFLSLEKCGVFFLFVLVGMILGVLLLICLLVLGTLALGGITITYLFSRLFIVFESFISIRSLPVGAYDTVTWVGYWPHIG